MASSDLGKAWESRHAPALKALADRFEVRAFCDPVAHRAAEVAQRWPARTCDGFRALAESDDIDAVLLLSARWYGALPILAACDAGKAIYCAAALDLDTHAADEVRQRVRDAGVAFMAEFPCRLAPATLRLKELMATRLGLPRLLFCNRRHTSRTDGTASLHVRHAAADRNGRLVPRRGGRRGLERGRRSHIRRSAAGLHRSGGASGRRTIW